MEINKSYGAEYKVVECAVAGTVLSLRTIYSVGRGCIQCYYHPPLPKVLRFAFQPHILQAPSFTTIFTVFRFTF